MARQAVLRCLLIILSMAIDAPSHLELRDRHEISDVRVGNEMEFVHVFDRSMTRLAFEPRLDVTVVSELDVFGEAMNLEPFDRLLLLPMFLQDSDAFDLVIFEGKLGMTAHTDFDGGNTSRLGLICAGVTVKAVDLEFSGVMLVAEGDRLARPRGLRIPCGHRRLACAQRRPLLVEFGGNLDFQLGVLCFLCAQRMGITDALRNEYISRRCVGLTAAGVGPARPKYERQTNEDRGANNSQRGRQKTVLKFQMRVLSLGHRRDAASSAHDGGGGKLRSQGSPVPRCRV